MAWNKFQDFPLLFTRKKILLVSASYSFVQTSVRFVEGPHVGKVQAIQIAAY
jgi:hypothetical protein